MDWTLKLFKELDLPEKILLAGHSHGGWVASLYASHFPERVESLFLVSPAGTTAYDPETYDILKMRDLDDITQPFISKAKAELKVKERLNAEHPYGIGTKVPYCIFERVYRKVWEGILYRTRYEKQIGKRDQVLPDEEISALIEYLCLQHYYWSATDIVQL